MTGLLAYLLIGAMVALSIYLLLTGRSNSEVKEWSAPALPAGLSPEFELAWYKDAYKQALRDIQTRDGVVRDLKQQILNLNYEIRLLADEVEEQETQAVQQAYAPGVFGVVKENVQ